MDSLTCFTPTQLRMIAKDIEKGDYLEQKIGLKDEQILNLQAQVSVRDSVILAEQ